ncbi:hypothetical protein D4100_19035 [Serratia inhibens]|uniref:Uncharacterized protein n=1 Tax=Serratia inhibens TaxID=2338073 RepID=A0AA92X2T1_9GAMM|nr:hypothetical protein [Serratia inhibens]RJF54071.1 hypothetical protein D4100_19035 [Serratia inhibens]
MLSIPGVLISNRHSISLKDETEAALAVIKNVEHDFLDNMVPACRQALTYLEHDMARSETVSNEVFRIFDDYFGIIRSSEKPLDVYIYSGIHCALIFNEEISSSATALCIEEQESLLRGIREAVLIGIDYLCIPARNDRVNA